MCIKALLSFGANVNMERQEDGSTALDLAEERRNSIPGISELLTQLGAKTSSQLYKQRQSNSIVVPLLHSYAENMKPPSNSEVDACSAKMKLYFELEEEVKRRISLSASYEEPSDDSYALMVQQRYLHKFRENLPESSVVGLYGGVKGGSRVLSLDGGGIRGLVQLEILMQLEEATGRKVTDLFDWIIGTSTGGIIALALVYGESF